MKTNEERIEDLQCKGLKIIQNKSLYTFSSDAVVLANFVKIKAKERALEIGAGSGVISILLSAKTPCKNFITFEMQECMARLANKNIELNGLQDKITVINDKIQNFCKYYPKGSFDVVYSNPPFMVSDGKREVDVRYIARHDIYLSISDFAKCASEALKEGGRFYCVYEAGRCAELIHQLIENRLEPKTLFFTENGKGKVNLVVIEAVKGGRHGVKVLPNLVTNDSDGNYLEKLHTRNFCK